MLHDEEADVDAESPVQPARKRPRSGNAAAQKRSTVLNESDDDSDWEMPKKTAGKGIDKGTCSRSQHLEGVSGSADCKADKVVGYA